MKGGLMLAVSYEPAAFSDELSAVEGLILQAKVENRSPFGKAGWASIMLLFSLPPVFPPTTKTRSQTHQHFSENRGQPGCLPRQTSYLPVV